MMNRAVSIRTKTAVIGTAIALGGVIGTGAILAAGSADATQAVASPVVNFEEVSKVPAGVNAKGLTFGSEADASSPSQRPDLISAYATNGKLGYVKNSDLHPAPPSSPAAALALQRVSEELAAKGQYFKSIPVFESDGVTVIGEFQLQTVSAGGK